MSTQNEFERRRARIQKKKDKAKGYRKWAKYMTDIGDVFQLTKAIPRILGPAGWILFVLGLGIRKAGQFGISDAESLEKEIDQDIDQRIQSLENQKPSSKQPLKPGRQPYQVNEPISYGESAPMVDLGGGLRGRIDTRPVKPRQPRDPFKPRDPIGPGEPPTAIT